MILDNPTPADGGGWYSAEASIPQNTFSRLATFLEIVWMARASGTNVQSGSSGVPMWDTRRPRPSAREAGRFERHVDVETDPDLWRWIRVGSSTIIVLKVTWITMRLVRGVWW